MNPSPHPSEDASKHSPIKSIIRHLASVLGTDELSVYRSCLASILDTRSCSYFLSSLDEKTISTYYKCNKPGDDPQFLSTENARDLTLLSRVTGVMLCVYQFCKARNSSVPLKYVDTRPQCWSLDYSSSSSEARSIACFALQRIDQSRGGYGSLIRIPSPVEEDCLMRPFIKKVQERVSGCALNALALLTAGGAPQAATFSSSKRSFSERSVMLRERDEMMKCLRERGGGETSVLIVSMKGLKKLAELGPDGTAKNFLSPSKFYYMLLAELADDRSGPSHHSTLVVAPRVEGGWYVFNDEFSRHISALFGAGEKSDASNRAFKRKRDSVIPEEFISSKRAKRGESARSEKREEERAKGDEREDDPDVFPCDCDVCEASVLYKHNMNTYGPQLAYKRDWSIFLQLKACGMMNDDLKGRLDLCFALSFGSFDLESSTEMLVKSARERSTVGDRIAEQKKIVAQKSWKHISDGPRVNSDESIHQVKIQRPILIGHLDFWHDAYSRPEDARTIPDLRTKSEEEMISRVKIFDTRGGAGVQGMVERYAEFLVRRRDQVAKFKEFLLRKELRIIEAYKERHRVFFGSEGIDEDGAQCAQAWKFSLLGRLETRLRKLIDRFTVWSFSGSSYDMVLILPSLVTAKCLKEFKPFIMRKGSEVTQLSYDSGLRFCDIAKLLSPGTSLQKLANAVGLRTKKMLMPYSLIDENLEFLSLPSLPSEPEAYYSELNHKQPTKEMILEAQRDFEAHGCASVGDYLILYLRIDVHLLHASLNLYLSKLCAITGCHVLDCDRYTLSSFSDVCAQNQLMTEKRPAYFICNSTRAYSLIRRSMTGGITQVMRNCVNWEECTGVKDSLANEHLSDLPDSALEMDAAESAKQRKKLRWVHYLDVASLYAASGKSLPRTHPLFFFFSFRERGP